MINQDFDAIIFDCDGTLVDSETITVRVLVDFVGEWGLDLDYDDALQLFVGRDMQMIVEVLESRLGSKLPNTFVEDYRERQSVALRRDLKVIPGADELLDAITKPFCLASNAPRDKIAVNLESSGLNRHFENDRTFSAYDINVWKPQPDLFHFAAEKMGVATNRCVVIEDSVAGIEAGLASGAQVIGFAQRHHEIPSDKVPFVRDLHSLIEVLAG